MGLKLHNGEPGLILKDDTVLKVGTLLCVVTVCVWCLILKVTWVGLQYVNLDFPGHICLKIYENGG